MELILTEYQRWFRVTPPVARAPFAVRFAGPSIARNSQSIDLASSAARLRHAMFFTALNADVLAESPNTPTFDDFIKIMADLKPMVK